MIMKHIGLQLLALLVCCAMISVGLVGCTEDKSPDGDKTPGGDVSDPTTDPEDTDGEKKELTVADFDPQKVYEQVDYFELDATKYVQLGRYKNLTLTIDPADYAVADATVQAKIDAILAEHHPDAKITDRPVQSGDTIVMDYVGKLDGVAFQGGTGLNQTITVTTPNGYIPGFVDGMVGLVPGEMKPVPVTFPENYGKEDLNGKDVIFEMTVHYIVGKPVLDDAFVASYTEGEMTTAKEFTASIRAELEKEQYDSVVRSALWGKINQNALVVEYPEDAVMYYYSYYYMTYSQYAAMYGVDLKTILSANGMTEQSMFDYCKMMVQIDLVRHAIYRAGNFTCPDADYQALLDEYTEANYDSLRTSMIASGETDYTREQARAYFDEHYGSQLRDTCLDTIVTEALLEGVTVEEESAS